jgi:D-beta-D-heptose 7-phosphate kinase/D-beta-D-heptose 1-phosphate adenosyltransferase
VAGPRLTELIASFPERRLGLLGDFYLDEYVYTHAVGVSPEMPVLRVREASREHTPGAAGNVALNLAGLGGAVSAFGVVGADAAGDVLLAALARRGVDVGGLVRHPDRVTGTFSRILLRGPTGADHHCVRVDREETEPLAAADRNEVARRLASRLGEFGALVVADYDETPNRSGIAVPELVAEVLAEARRRGVLTAGLSRRHPTDLAGVDVLFCNVHEARRLGLDSTSDLERWSADILRRHRLRCVCVTLAEAGVFARRLDEVVRLPAVETTVVDACGAGDSLASAFLLALLSGASLEESALLGTRAASVVIQVAGTVPVTAPGLTQVVDRQGPGPAKCLDGDRLLPIVDAVRPAKKIVFTNGYFDLFHAGHIDLLEAARKLGDVLIVGINSDRSTRLNKGAGRPLLPESDRVRILAALECVDYVTVFDDLTPIALIHALKPDVLVKGGDYRLDEVLGKDIVEAGGGRVVVIPYQSDWTTKRLIQSVKAASDGSRSR